MVFVNLGPQEKDAFFSLLDEYFASRPEILAKFNNTNHDTQTAVAAAASMAAASAVRDAAVKHPEATAKFISSGLKHLADNRTTVSGSGNNNGSGGGESAEESPTMAGRVAAAQAMFSGKHNPFSKQPSSTPGPPTPPYGASTLKSGGFAAPPVRRTPSSTTNTRLPPPPAAPPPVKEEQGEWVEALYDYESSEAGDLKLKEGRRILLVERTSDDWWTGKLDGEKGLFPASYVKVL